MQKSIMIVDDNEMIRRNLRHLFHDNSNWAVCAEANDGPDAIDKAREFHPDFVVMDFCMPLMNGVEAARKIKHFSPNSSIVMLTAFKNRILEQKAYQAGVSWVLSKEDASKILDFARILLRPESVCALPHPWE
jgi:two-component system, NarL family, response regulator DegU